MLNIYQKLLLVIFCGLCIVYTTGCSKYKNYSDPYVGDCVIMYQPGLYDDIKIIAKGDNELLIERMPLGTHDAYVNLNAVATKDKLLIPEQTWVVYFSSGDCWFCETNGGFIRWKISGYGELMNGQGSGLSLHTDIYEKEEGESEFEFVISEEFILEYIN
ncbi:MAG: hypothetical protein IPM77_03065 [Crocinitomicaceae bacterium]|nr:hypothetical protein [Crocinitomicaceae bacterium]